jgi:hypothetical protein
LPGPKVRSIVSFRENLIRLAQKDPVQALSVDKSKEGLISHFGDGNFYFHLNGMKSHLEVYFGVRFLTVSEKIRESIKAMPQFSFLRETATNPLMGIFYLKVGDFCENFDDIDVFCPKGSEVLSPEGMLSRLNEILASNIRLSALQEAINFTVENNLLSRVNQFYFGTACAIAGRRELLEDLVKKVEKEKGFIKAGFDDYVGSLR